MNFPTSLLLLLLFLMAPKNGGGGAKAPSAHPWRGPWFFVKKKNTKNTKKVSTTLGENGARRGI